MLKYSTMPIQIFPKDQQASGAFNGGEITENKPLGFPGEGGTLQPYGPLFYWAHADAHVDSTIGLHPHRGFEIMSFVLAGTIRHYDTKLKAWQELYAGDAQIIRAGDGISHAEWMGRGSQMFQIWLDPNLNETLALPASYDDYKAADFSTEKTEEYERTTLIGENSPFELRTPGVNINRYRVKGNMLKLKLDANSTYGIYQLEGTSSWRETSIQTRDFVLVEEASEIQFENCQDAEFFVLRTPTKTDYPTYAQMMRMRGGN